VTTKHAILDGTFLFLFRQGNVYWLRNGGMEALFKTIHAGWPLKRSNESKFLSCIVTFVLSQKYSHEEKDLISVWITLFSVYSHLTIRPPKSFYAINAVACRDYIGACGPH